MSSPILVGVDDSDAARSAAITAAALAESLEVELHVATAFGKFEAERHSVSRDHLGDDHVQALAIAELAHASVRAAHPGVTVKVHAVDGRPAEALVRTAEELDAEVIVVGNKRVQGLSRMLGSIASDVAKNAHCDVLIAHTH